MVPKKFGPISCTSDSDWRSWGVPGQWNTVEITMDGTHMTVIYNGRKVVDGHDSRRSSGCIALDLAQPAEAPDANIEFRNLKIKRLP